MLTEVIHDSDHSIGCSVTALIGISVQNANGEQLGPRQTYTYISPVSRLKSTYSNKEYCAMIEEYLGRRQQSDPEFMDDVHDGSYYRGLMKQSVKWYGVEQKPRRTYFQDLTDIALGLATNDVTLYKRSRLDAWPLLFTNFSLPPEVRTLQGDQICCGIIPGTSSDVERNLNLDSFLYPLVQDLKKLALGGVAARRWVGGEIAPQFYLIIRPANLPNAVLRRLSQLWRSLSSKPDRVPAVAPCPINPPTLTPVVELVHTSDVEPPLQPSAAPKQRFKTTYYIARKPSDLPLSLQARNIRDIDYANLPKRNDAGVKAHVIDIIVPGITASERDARSMKAGISGASIFHEIGSIEFPKSFPVDIMHVLLENVMKQQAAGIVGWVV
ncbi:hypothetical protein QFC22_006095 [Naganishia vaughanmartiniae]|uniref:Uncharacterized protein n=1 Tax=Naganishia vaughanmartiniae TaxID=1424756 RepID=A0ACC2WP88_9TREE|nr:hypothetical protein QFC22_006095 [Naganishia vaughanmartiniae]